MSNGFLGEIRMFAGRTPPPGWALCDGTDVPAEGHEALIKLLGGSVGSPVKLPDYRGRLLVGAGAGNGLTERRCGQTGGEERVVLTKAQMPEHKHTVVASRSSANTVIAGPGVGFAATVAEDRFYVDTGAPLSTNIAKLSPHCIGTTGGGAAHSNLMPAQAINFIISLQDGSDGTEAFLGEIRLFAFGFAPQRWMPCDGRTINVRDNTPLFSVLGTTYGGDGRSAFCLPKLEARVALGAGARDFPLGAAVGAESVQLTQSELPSHNHLLERKTAVSNITGKTAAPGPRSHPGAMAVIVAGTPKGVNCLQKTGSPDSALAPGTVTETGSGRPHNNLQPYLDLNFSICVQGRYPM